MATRQVIAVIHCAAWLAGRAGSAATLTIAPTADTYIEPYGSETKNHGAEPQLRLDQWCGRQVLLRFPLSDVPPGKRIIRATVRLFITNVGFNDYGEFPDLKTCLGLFDLVTPWTELGATFNTSDGQTPWNQGPGIPGGKYGDVGPLPKPDIGVNLRQPTIALEPGKVTKDSWLELGVTEFLRWRERAGDKEVNLLLRTSLLGRSYTFVSREAKEEDQRPRLVVELSDALPDFTLSDVFLTDWKEGRAVAVTLKHSGQKPTPLGPPRWRLARKPEPSRLKDTALKQTAQSVSFVPDAPGLYRLRCEVSLGTALPGAAAPWTAETAEVYALSVPPHPRLYVTPERLASLRQQANGGARLFTAFKARVDSGNGGLAKGQYHDSGLQEGCEDNALMYLLTSDTEYAQNSATYAQLILKKPMREHFTDVHGATFIGANWAHAMAVHYDWCYDRLTPDHRRAVADWLKEAAAWSWVRSGAPIAHNDGGGRQIILASAPLALLGEDPGAPEYLRRCHENFDNNLLPWLNDGGRGGRGGDGGEYEGLHSFFIVRYAWLARTATGEDVFSESPFFFNRIKHVLFGWYPRRLFDRNGQFSIRTYYSPSGDHIRLGYVGDTQPYQSAAALCDRYREAPEAQYLRWLAGEWPTKWMQYCLKWAVLGDFDNVPAKQPPANLLSYLDEGCQTVYMRSDWSDDATWVLFENGPYVSVHQSLDKGGFEVFKGDLLAARTGNLDHGNVGAPHAMNYLHRTISGNCLLINDPAEKWKGFLAGAEGASDGGGERTNFPLSAAPDCDTYLNYRHIFQRGHITRLTDSREFTYALADVTDAYNSPTFSGINKPKVTSITRQLLYLRALDSVLVFDRVSSTNPGFRKAWLLHSLGDLDVLDGKEAKVDDGEYHYTGATKAVIRYGWPKPVPSFGRCLSVTLLPENAQIVKIGGRVDLSEGQTEAFPGDQWHGKHRHRHLKDFWVNGANYPPGNPPETRWFGDPATEWYVPGTPDETGGRGKWRMEVSPPGPAKDDVFFHVLCPRLGREGRFPEVTRFSAAPFDGALVTEGNNAAGVLFAHDEKQQTAFTATLPGGKKWLLIVADLAPGKYAVSLDAKAPITVAVGDSGLLTLGELAGGVVRVSRRG